MVTDWRNAVDTSDEVKVYIAGPMRGYEDYNFPAFYEMEDHLWKLGYFPVNPARMDKEEGDPSATGGEALPLKHYLTRDLPALLSCDMVVVLDGWEDSQGALAEVAVARQCGIRVINADWNNVDVDIVPPKRPMQGTRHPSSEKLHLFLQEAGWLHDRKQADYGTGTDPFANVRASEEFGIPAWLGAIVRLNDKVQRLKSFALSGTMSNESAVDSFMDIAVYALIARVLFEEEQDAKENAARAAGDIEHVARPGCLGRTVGSTASTLGLKEDEDGRS